MLLNRLGSALQHLDLPRADDLSRRNMVHLLLAYLLISLPMMSIFPVWLTALALFTVVVKALVLRYHLVLSKWWALPILILAMVMIGLNFRDFGREYAGLALLFVFASLKLLESREARDAFLLMLIYFLLMLGSLMASKSALTFAYILLCFFYNMYIQLRIAQPDNLSIPIKQNLKTLVKIFLLATPFVVGLFFLFPRINPLWKQPPVPRSVTGLSDEMTPQSLSQLALDGGLAFRVQFDGKVPPYNLLYWRGPVLSQFDGKTWRRDGGDLHPPESLQVEQDSKITYTTYHDGSTSYWVVPLDLPADIPNNTRINQAFEIGSRDALSKPTAFKLQSYSRYKNTAITAEQRRYNTFLPAGIFPRTRELAAQLRDASKDSDDFVQRVWQYFRDNEFYYDLEPPPGNSDIDTFVFENRVGYCEHYSSTFAFMMRSQGVPARVVTGYQGGELNTVSKEWEVKQLNAHAWTEVYLADKGWVRIDPTAAVAPSRINRGSPMGVARNSDSVAFAERLESSSELYKSLSTSLRAMNAFWQNWVINYDHNKQSSLWQRLGLAKVKDVMWIAFIVLFMPLVALLGWWYKRRAQRLRGDAVWQAMQPFIKHLHKHDINKAEGTAWRDFVHGTDFGNCQANAEQVISCYYRLRYESSSHTDSLRRLKNAVALFVQKYHG